jgi:hypothetical protein
MQSMADIRCQAVEKTDEWPYARRCQETYTWENVLVPVGEFNPGVKGIAAGSTAGVILHLCDRHKEMVS